MFLYLIRERFGCIALYVRLCGVSLFNKVRLCGVSLFNKGEGVWGRREPSPP